MKTLLLLLSFINFWLDMKTFEENDYLKVNYSKHFDQLSFSFSVLFCDAALVEPSLRGAGFKNFDLIKSENSSPTKDGYLQRSYMMFLLGIAITAIGIEILLNRKANAIKQANDSLVVHHQVMLMKNNSLNSKLKSLQKSTEKNSRLFQVMAHDLRSPVAAIVGLSSFMIDEKKLPPEDMQVIDLIYASGQDSLRFINEILHNEDTSVYEKKNVDLKQLVGYCIAQLDVAAAEKNQQFILQGEQLFLNLDRAKIWRVLSNILGNAVKFSQPFGTITVAISQHNQLVRVAVSDQGIGIPDELKDQIFSDNEQRKRKGTQGEQSFGIGLAVAKQHVEAHGGTLTFESIVGKGTTFYMDLPSY